MDACLDYLRENGAEPALVIDPHTVVTAPWTTFKCQFGCENFGKNHCCPPEAPDYAPGVGGGTEPFRPDSGGIGPETP